MLSQGPPASEMLLLLLLLLLLLPLQWSAEWTSGERPWVPNQDEDLFSREGWPRRPSYKLFMPESVTVQEGLCVLVFCRISYRPSDYDTGSGFGYWFRAGDNPDYHSPVATDNPDRPVQEETRGRFHFLGDRWDNCSLDIQDAQKSDNGSYFFWKDTMPRNWDYIENYVFVHVTDPPQNLTATVSGGAGPGKSAPGTQQVLLLAFGLAAVKILLLILCVTLLSVRSRRRKAARPAAGRERAHTHRSSLGTSL